jgi:hypothetical protein
MYDRTVISALVFAAFGFCFFGQARAQDCNNPDFCFDWGIPVAVDNFTGSSVECVLDPGGASNPFNTLDIGSGLGGPNGTFHQTGTATCKHKPDNISLGACTFELTWTGVSLSSCTDNTFSATALCKNIIGEGYSPASATVTGTIECGPKTMNLGIAGIANTYAENCTTVFPPDANLSAGQVLNFTITTEGPQCTGAFVAISDVKERYCNSGEPSNYPGAVDCTPGGSTRRTTNPDTTALTSVVPFDFDVRQTVNVKPCNGDNDKGNANIDILGSASFDVASATVLACGGSVEPGDLAPLSDCKTQDVNHDGFPDLACKVDTCPVFQEALGALPRNDDGTVTATCTGQLQSGTGILGFADVKVTPKK